MGLVINSVRSRSYFVRVQGEEESTRVSVVRLASLNTRQTARDSRIKQRAKSK